MCCVLSVVVKTFAAAVDPLATVEVAMTARTMYSLLLPLQFLTPHSLVEGVLPQSMATCCARRSGVSMEHQGFANAMHGGSRRAIPRPAFPYCCPEAQTSFMAASRKWSPACVHWRRTDNVAPPPGSCGWCMVTEEEMRVSRRRTMRAVRASPGRPR